MKRHKRNIMCGSSCS